MNTIEVTVKGKIKWAETGGHLIIEGFEPRWMTDQQLKAEGWERPLPYKLEERSWCDGIFVKGPDGYTTCFFDKEDKELAEKVCALINKEKGLI